MKKFSKSINEGCVTADVNPGNAYSNTGVMNHLTPVGNIVTQIRNLFSPLTGVVASVAEDGFSVKLNSSKFVSKEEVNKILYDMTSMRNVSIDSLIRQSGLNVQKLIPIGQYFVVYYSPSDIKGAKPGVEPEPANLPCKEMLSIDNDEVEMFAFITESDDDEELKDITKEKINELIKAKDKVKAAKQLELLVTQEMELPREYYFAGVKSKDGDESIALRWKYTRKRPHNRSSESVRSILNIFDDSDEGIWVQDFVKDSMFQLPDEVKKLIESVLEFLGAEKTNDPAVWSLKDTDKKDKKDEEEKKDDKEEDKKSNKEESDDEDDNSRGDSSDDLLS